MANNNWIDLGKVGKFLGQLKEIKEVPIDEVKEICIPDISFDFTYDLADSTEDQPIPDVIPVGSAPLGVSIHITSKPEEEIKDGKRYIRFRGVVEGL